MSSIDLQKLGLPSQSRTKEIIEEDYPSISLANRMAIIQKQFAERQNEQPKDITQPPENVQQVYFQFESVFNQLLGLMKRFISMNIQTVKLSNITQIVQSYLQLSSIYNAYVLPQLPSNELLRRQIYEKLDMLASASGQIIQNLSNNNLNIVEDIRGIQVGPQATMEFINLFESIRRDSLTRILRPVSFGSDFPLPGQPRNFNPLPGPPGPPGIGGPGGPGGPGPVDPRFTGRVIAGPGQPPVPGHPPVPELPGINQEEIERIRQRQRRERNQADIRRAQLEHVGLIPDDDAAEAIQQFERDQNIHLIDTILAEFGFLPQIERNLIIDYVRNRGYNPLNLEGVPVEELRQILGQIRQMAQERAQQQGDEF